MDDSTVVYNLVRFEVVSQNLLSFGARLNLQILAEITVRLGFARGGELHGIRPIEFQVLFGRVDLYDFYFVDSTWVLHPDLALNLLAHIDVGEVDGLELVFVGDVEGSYGQHQVEHVRERNDDRGLQQTPCLGSDDHGQGDGLARGKDDRVVLVSWQIDAQFGRVSQDVFDLDVALPLHVCDHEFALLRQKNRNLVKSNVVGLHQYFFAKERKGFRGL